MSAHSNACPDPCRHDNECPHGRSNLAGETCLICEGEGSLSDINAEWKVIRRAADAVSEVVDNAVQDLIDEYNIPDDDEDALNALTDHIYALVTTGKVE